MSKTQVPPAQVPPALRLGIVAKSGKTLTQIPFKLSTGGREIVFRNNAAAEMRVDFVPPDRVLNEKGKEVAYISVAAGSQETILVSNFRPGDELRYTAKVDGAAPEDPIIIFEE